MFLWSETNAQPHSQLLCGQSDPYRHDSILHHIQKCLDTNKFICYTDIAGHQTQDGGTVPPDVLVTTLKPDIVIIDKKSKTLDIFELTVPGETRIQIAHNLKYEKYQHFTTDVMYIPTEFLLHLLKLDPTQDISQGKTLGQ